MAALMVLGVFGAAISAFAISEDVVTSNIPSTGQKDTTLPIIIAVVSLLVAIICVIMAPKKKKKTVENVEDDYIEVDAVERGLNFFTSRKEDVYMEMPEDNTESSEDEIIEE